MSASVVTPLSAVAVKTPVPVFFGYNLTELLDTFSTVNTLVSLDTKSISEVAQKRRDEHPETRLFVRNNNASEVNK